MISSEHELISAVYAIYLFDCLHWLAPGEIAMTRKMVGGWYVRRVEILSFTLLGRLPFLTNPVDFRPGLIRFKEPEFALATSDHKQLNSICYFGRLLPLYCGSGAMLFLLLLPLLAEFGWLPIVWVYLLAALLSIHVLIVTEFLRKGCAWRAEDPASFWRSFTSLCINPLAALRTGDVLAENTFRISIAQKRKQAATAQNPPSLPPG
jgi:hypothetical protein